MLPSKRQIFESGLDQPSNLSGSVMVLFNLGWPGVSIDQAFYDSAEDGMLWFRYSLRFGVKLNVTESGIEASLSKGGVSYDTFVPWGAVVAVVEESTQTQVWWRPESAEETKANDPPEKPKRHLKLVTDPIE